VALRAQELAVAERDHPPVVEHQPVAVLQVMAIAAAVVDAVIEPNVRVDYQLLRRLDAGLEELVTLDAGAPDAVHLDGGGIAERLAAGRRREETWGDGGGLVGGCADGLGSVEKPDGEEQEAGAH
jgi:hypothetical protein